MFVTFTNNLKDLTWISKHFLGIHGSFFGRYFFESTPIEVHTDKTKSQAHGLDDRTHEENFKRHHLEILKMNGQKISQKGLDLLDSKKI